MQRPPDSWTGFLGVDKKTELFSFLSDILQDSSQLADKNLVIIEGDYVFSKLPLLDTTVLTARNHEEANCHMMMHAA